MVPVWWRGEEAAAACCGWVRLGGCERGCEGVWVRCAASHGVREGGDELRGVIFFFISCFVSAVSGFSKEEIWGACGIVDMLIGNEDGGGTW